MVSLEEKAAASPIKLIFQRTLLPADIAVLNKTKSAKREGAFKSHGTTCGNVKMGFNFTSAVFNYTIFRRSKKHKNCFTVNGF